MMTHSRTRTLAECALLIAMGTVLSYIPIFEMPQGGSITLCSTLPLVMVSFRHGTKWGVLTCTVHGMIQLMLGFKNVLYCTTIWAMIGCALLDYIIAYMVIGFSARLSPRGSFGMTVGVLTTGLLRYFCSFLSGILIWGGWAPEGTPVWIYSLVYNGSFMIPELLLTTIASIVLVRLFAKRAVAVV